MVPVFSDTAILGPFPGKYSISSTCTALTPSALIVPKPTILRNYNVIMT